MTYVMSDIHGEYDKYMAMLREIDLRPSDLLYVLGDVVDRGPHPIKILKDMSMRGNVLPLLGNHDATAAYLLKRSFPPTICTPLRCGLRMGATPRLRSFARCRPTSAPTCWST